MFSVGFLTLLAVQHIKMLAFGLPWLLVILLLLLLAVVAVVLLLLVVVVVVVGAAGAACPAGRRCALPRNTPSALRSLI